MPIHLAVEPVIAGHTLYPGTNVGIKDGKAYSNLDKAHPSFVEKHLGIVDPFLKEPVKPGEMFWLIVYPRQITSLRHVWEHPDFPSKETLELVQKITDKMSGVYDSKKWIEDFANGVGLDYDTVMVGAEEYIRDGEYISREFLEGESVPDEFWDHYEKVTGTVVKKRGSFFTCSC